MTCPHCGAPGQSTGRCSACGRPVQARGARPWILIALAAVVLLVLGGTAALASRSGQVAGSAVAATRFMPEPEPAVDITRPDRTEEPSTSVEEEPSESAEPEAPTSATEAPAPEGPAPIGIAYDLGGSWDGTFNAMAKAGLERAVTEFGVEVIERAPSDDQDWAATLTELAELGSNPVIGIGYSWSEAADEVASDFPDTTFVLIDGYSERPNVIPVWFAEEEGSFLVGVAAALRSGGRIGFLGAVDNEWTGYYRAGFEAGATAVKPDIDITVEYLGDEADEDAWSSRTEAAEIATTWYAEGIDVIYSPSGASAEGVVDAAIQAGEGKWVVGYDYDDYLFIGPGRQQVILTSMVKRYDEVVYLAVQAARNDDLNSLPEFAGLAVDGVGYSTSGGFVDDLVPQLDEWKARIASGAIIVPFD